MEALERILARPPSFISSYVTTIGDGTWISENENISSHSDIKPVGFEGNLYWLRSRQSDAVISVHA
jgi:hypothetical protein